MEVISWKARFPFPASIPGKSFRREPLPSAPPTKSGIIDFIVIVFFDCELTFEAADFEFYKH